MLPRSNYSIRVVGFILIALSLLLSQGCMPYFKSLTREIPDPPPLAQIAPVISNLSVHPTSIPDGTTTRIHVRFDYVDPNEDVGPAKADVLLEYTVLSGNLVMDKPRKKIQGNFSRKGYSGTIYFERSLQVGWGGYGRVRLSVSLFDNRGNQSDRLSEILYIG